MSGNCPAAAANRERLPPRARAHGQECRFLVKDQYLPNARVDGGRMLCFFGVLRLFAQGGVVKLTRLCARDYSESTLTFWLLQARLG